MLSLSELLLTRDRNNIPAGATRFLAADFVENLELQIKQSTLLYQAVQILCESL